MIGISDIGAYVPESRISNLARLQETGKTESFIKDKVGFVEVARKRAEEDTSDLCVRAFEALCGKRELRAEDVDCVVVCTQNPDAHGLPHTAAIVQHKLGLRHEVAAFDISLGCSGYVYSLSVVKAFMAENNLTCGLLFTADPYSKILDPEDHDTDLLFGDAATATLLTDQSPRLRIRPGKFATNGALGHSIAVPKAGEPLYMHGSNVFKFSMTVVPEQVRAYLNEIDATPEDVSLFLLHQGSRFIVENLARKLGIPAEKAPFMAATIGNTVSSTIPVMLADKFESIDGLVIICGFGVGLSWATLALEPIKQEDSHG